MPKKKQVKICNECGEDHYRRSKYCSVDCGKKQIRKPEIRNKISLSRKNYLKNNPEKHPWKKSNKQKSIPCEKVKDFLRKNNINFIEEWNPIPDRYFAIDIAFPDIKFGIEINGNQHYDSDGNLKPYYQNRHDLIVGYGWTLLELHYSSCFNLENIVNIINIKEQPDYREYFEIMRLKKEKTKTLPKGVKNKLKYEEKWEPYKDLVLNSNIDFSKFGWVTKVSKILNIPPQHVNKWMKKFLPEFYHEKCFKRKTN